MQNLLPCFCRYSDFSGIVYSGNLSEKAVIGLNPTKLLHKQLFLSFSHVSHSHPQDFQICLWGKHRGDMLCKSTSFCLHNDLAVQRNNPSHFHIGKNYAHPNCCFACLFIACDASYKILYVLFISCGRDCFSGKSLQFWFGATGHT